MTNIVTTLFDAADAPHLRAQVAELEAAVTRLTEQVARLERDNKRLTADAAFHFESFTGKQLKIAENAWGLPGGG